jgi:hypothetical protein
MHAESYFLRAAKAAVLAIVCLTLSGCDFGRLITDALNAVGMASEKTVRISGETYFKLDKKDSKDGAYSQNGYLCVVHDPGCGDVTGEDGEDTFFLARQLPPLATLTAFRFEVVPPAGMAASYNPGPSGSFDTTLQPGIEDGSQPIRISWHNACWGPYANKPAVYRVTMDVRVKGNLDLIDQAFDPDETVDVPACRFESVPEVEPCVSGQTSSVLITMNQISATADGLIYAGTTNTGLLSPCENRLQTLSASQVNVPVLLLKEDGEKCADAVVRLGPGLKLQTSEDDQTAIFGEAHPKHPITLRGCAAVGGNTPPSFFVLVATFTVS